MNVLTAIPALTNGLTAMEKQILNQDDSIPFISTIKLVKNLKSLSPDIRRKIIDSIVSDLGKDTFLVSLADYMDSRK